MNNLASKFILAGIITIVILLVMLIVRIVQIGYGY